MGDLDALLASLSLEDKVALLAGADAWHTVARPGVPALRCSDGPAGVRGTSWQGPPSASFPCGTALAASFDPELVEEVGAALGREARAKGAHLLLGPTINLHRTPVGGRNFECLSEDPVLTAAVAVAYVRGVQGEGVAACAKHFVANDTEHERMTISSEVDERTLRELYLAPFEAVVAPVAAGGAGVRAVMSAYNKVNGTYASEHGPLLRGVLRDEWGFDGLVTSDWFGTHSAAASLEAGLDLEMPGPPRHRGDHLLAAVRAGEVGEDRVDQSVRRLLALLEWCEVGATPGPERSDGSPRTRAVLHRAAVAGTVLLRNEGAVLPLAPGLRLALIGPHAARLSIQGGGSAQVRPEHPVGLLDALRDRGVEVAHEQGCAIAKRLPVLRGTHVVTFTGADGATATQEAERLSLVWMDAPAEGVDLAHFGVRTEGTFTPQVGGDWHVGLSVVGPAVLRVDGEVVVDLAAPEVGGGFFGLGSAEHRAVVHLEAGVPCTVEVDQPVVRSDGLRGLRVGAEPPATGDGMERAVAAAAAADVAVVVVGTDGDWETEGEDRPGLDLPGDQDELVARVAAANPRTVVVVNAGSPVAMPWVDQVAAVAQVWFPGGEAGNAVADVLLGDAEPGGRLPVTLPRRLEDTPAHAHHPGRDGRAVYGEGLLVGHRWYDAQGIEPAFPFGHGLGYTTFELTGPSVSGTPQAAVVRCTVRNTGARTGSEVVQVYVAGPPEPGRPPRVLAGFAKVELAPGGEAVVEVALDERAFRSWDVAGHRWALRPGRHRVLVGRSSRSLAPAGALDVV